MTDYYAVLDATWPAAATRRAGPWLIREGQGGGKRVSAATAAGDWTDGDIATAEAAQSALEQPALFMLRPEDTALDAALAARGYEIVDPVTVYAGPAAPIAAEVPPPISIFTIWPPLEILRDLWAEGGIGPARIAVMERALGPRTAVLGRINDRAAGAAFAAIHDGAAMLHALYVPPEHRRQDVARRIVRGAAIWATEQGADDLCVVVTDANAPANALYRSLGMRAVGRYHYRQKP